MNKAQFFALFFLLLFLTSSASSLVFIPVGARGPQDKGVITESTQELFDKINEINNGKDTINLFFGDFFPPLLMTVFGNERTNFYIERKDKKIWFISLELTDKFESISTSRTEKPTINVCVTEDAFDSILSAENINASLSEAIKSGKMKVEGLTFASAVKIAMLKGISTADLSLVFSQESCGPKADVFLNKIVQVGTNQSVSVIDPSSKEGRTADVLVIDPAREEAGFKTAADGKLSIETKALGWHALRTLDGEVLLNQERYIVVDLGFLNVFGASGVILDSINTLERLGNNLIILLFFLSLFSGFISQNRSYIFFPQQVLSSRQEKLVLFGRFFLGGIAFVLPWFVNLISLASIGVFVALIEVIIILIAFVVIKLFKKAQEFKPVHVNP